MGRPSGESSAPEAHAHVNEMKLIKFEKTHAYEILEKNVEMGVQLTYDWEEMAEKWSKSNALTLIDENGRPILCGGIYKGDWKQGEAWALSGPTFPVSGFKAAKRTLDRMARDMGLIRVQSHTLTTLVQAHHMLHHLGFEWEGWPRKAGPNQEDLFLFGKIYEER
jgi:hypothetical protein